MQGFVRKSSGKLCLVELDDGSIIECSVRGKFRIKGLNVTNPVSIGDRVIIEHTQELGKGVITDILPRRNFLVRKSPHAKKTSIIGANLDQLVLVVTIKEPRTSTGFIDRFLATADVQQIPVLIVVNKKDIYNNTDIETWRNLSELYNSIGYETVLISSFDKNDIDLIRSKMQDKLSLISGHSGVGKSTLVNALIPDLEIYTQEISEKYLKGMHTTTHAEIYDLPEGGQLIDTPGIKEFGVEGIDADFLKHCFREFEKFNNACKFNDCIHLNEPGCAVKAAIQDGKIAESRYQNYVKILEEIKSENSW